MADLGGGRALADGSPAVVLYGAGAHASTTATGPIVAFNLMCEGGGVLSVSMVDSAAPSSACSPRGEGGEAPLDKLLLSYHRSRAQSALERWRFFLGNVSSIKTSGGT